MRIDEWVTCECGASYAVYETYEGNKRIDSGEGYDTDYCTECGRELPIPEKSIVL